MLVDKDLFRIIRAGKVLVPQVRKETSSAYIVAWCMLLACFLLAFISAK